VPRDTLSSVADLVLSLYSIQATFKPRTLKEVYIDQMGTRMLLARPLGTRDLSFALIRLWKTCATIPTFAWLVKRICHGSRPCHLMFSIPTLRDQGALGFLRASTEALGFFWCLDRGSCIFRASAEAPKNPRASVEAPKNPRASNEAQTCPRASVETQVGRRKSSGLEQAARTPRPWS